MEKENAKEVRCESSFNYGEYEFNNYMYCPSCNSNRDVGNYDDCELYFNYCPNCGQKLKYTEELYV